MNLEITSEELTCPIPWGPGNPYFDRDTVYCNLVRIAKLAPAEARRIVENSTSEECGDLVKKLFAQPALHLRYG